MFIRNPTVRTAGWLLWAATFVVSTALSLNAVLELHAIPGPLIWGGLVLVTIGLTVFPAWWFHTMGAKKDEFLRSLMVKRFIAASLVMLSLITPVGMMQHYHLLPSTSLLWGGLAFWMTYFAMHLFIRSTR